MKENEIYNPKLSYYKTKYKFQSFKFLAYLLDIVERFQNLCVIFGLGIICVKRHYSKNH